MAMAAHQLAARNARPNTFESRQPFRHDEIAGTLKNVISGRLKYSALIFDADIVWRNKQILKLSWRQAACSPSRSACADNFYDKYAMQLEPRLTISRWRPNDIK